MAVLFDAYGTLFDVYSVGVPAERLFPGFGERLGLIWRDKQIEYTRLVSMSGQRRSFRELTRAGLRYAAARLGLALTDEAEARLMAQLRASRAVSRERARPRRAEAARHPRRHPQQRRPRHARRARRHAGFQDLLDPVLSVEGTGRFKTDPAAYASVRRR